MFIVIVGGALCGWALLAVMGAERERLHAEAEAKRPLAAPRTSAPAKPASAKPTSAKPAPPPRVASKLARAEKNAR